MSKPWLAAANLVTAGAGFFLGCGGAVAWGTFGAALAGIGLVVLERQHDGEDDDADDVVQNCRGYDGVADLGVQLTEFFERSNRNAHGGSG